MSRKKHVIYEVTVYRAPDWFEEWVIFRTKKTAERYVEGLVPGPGIEWDGPYRRVIS